MQNFHKAQEGRKNEVPGRLPLAQSLCRRQKTAPAGAMLPPGLSSTQVMKGRGCRGTSNGYP